MPTRQILPARRAQVTHKIRVGHRRTLYLSTQDASPPLELFVRVRGHDCTAETIALYDVLARLTSVALQYGAPLERRRLRVYFPLGSRPFRFTVIIAAAPNERP